ncbi:MAG: glycoside hydrolase family 20 zincin-like fold domain-containing protein, partial [Syntrophothermus sp.]
MKKSLPLRLIFLILLAFVSTEFTFSGITIVPKPVKIKEGKGIFVVNDNTPLLCTAGNPEAMRTARFFAGHLQYSGGPVLTAKGVGKKYKNLQGILFLLNPGLNVPAEGYHLKVSKKNIIVEASTG